jgi:hypothetical protein
MVIIQKNPAIPYRIAHRQIKTQKPSWILKSLSIHFLMTGTRKNIKPLLRSRTKRLHGWQGEKRNSVFLIFHLFIEMEAIPHEQKGNQGSQISYHKILKAGKKWQLHRKASIRH